MFCVGSILTAQLFTGWLKRLLISERQTNDSQLTFRREYLLHWKLNDLESFVKCVLKFLSATQVFWVDQSSLKTLVECRKKTSVYVWVLCCFCRLITQLWHRESSFSQNRNAVWKLSVFYTRTGPQGKNIKYFYIFLWYNMQYIYIYINGVQWF